MRRSEAPSFWNTSVGLAAPLVALGLVALWCGLLSYLTRDVLNAGKTTFIFLFILCDLIVVAKFVKPLPITGTARRLNTVVCVLAILATLPFFYQHAITLRRVYYGNAGSDFPINTRSAAQYLFDRGKNPYTTRNELWWDPTNAPHVTKVGDQLYMFGVPYYRGYPYFPAMILTYEPLRRIDPSLTYIRLGNLICYLATFIAVAWLTALFVPRGYKTVGAILAIASLACVWILGWDYFGEGQTDVIIPMFGLFGFLAAYYRRPTLSGVMLGWAFACKLLPGGFFALIMLGWYWRQPDRWKFAVSMVATFLAVMVPFIAWNPKGFLSATILYYLTEHARGDDTALYHFVPEALQGIYLLLGYGVVLAFLLRVLLNRSLTLLGAVASSFVAFIIFMAFSKMDHPNYLMGILPIGSVALVGYALQRAKEPATEDMQNQEASVSAFNSAAAAV